MSTTLLLRFPAVQERTACARSTLYNLINDGLFPRPVAISSRTVAWPETEVEAINQLRVSSASEDEVRALVIQLESSRKGEVAVRSEEGQV